MNKDRMTIPEKLGFASPDEDEERREKPFSELSYRARYILYPDEAQELLQRFNTHPDIEDELNRRYIHDSEYHERVEGGYALLQKQMRADGRVSQEEAEIVDRLNMEQGEPAH